MPIYEYACASCGEVFEALILRKSDETNVACPACQAPEPSRRMSRPAAARVVGPGGGGPPTPCGPVG